MRRLGFVIKKLLRCNLEIITDIEKTLHGRKSFPVFNSVYITAFVENFFLLDLYFCVIISPKSSSASERTGECQPGNLKI